MADPPTLKEPTGTTAGGAQKWGGPDAVHCAELIKGTHSTEKIQPEAIDSSFSSIPCVISVAQGIIASPDIHDLVTQDSKISGWILPDGATLSEINFKCKVPDALNASPAAKIRVTIMTLGASSGNLRLQVSTKAAADTENIDLAFDLETEQTIIMPTAIETMDVYEQTLTNQPSAGDLLTGQLKRDPVDSLDTYANDVIIVAIELIITRNT